MFEAVEVGRSIAKSRFDELERDMHVDLLALQRELRTAPFSLIILVAGVECAGKGDVVRRLNRWFDTRGVHNLAFWKPSDEEQSRPYFYRFWRQMPPRGAIAIMFGSWYSQPIIDHAHHGNHADLDQAMLRNRRLEQMLVEDHVLLVKLWYHLTNEQQQRRLKAEARRGTTSHLEQQQRYADQYQRFVATAERAIRLTDTGYAPWHLVEATDNRYRDLATGEILKTALRQRLATASSSDSPSTLTDVTPACVHGAEQTILDRVDLSRHLDAKAYKSALRKAKDRLRKLCWLMHEQGVNLVAVFEGWDAAGKGGAIRRLLSAVDPRLYRVISIAAPTDEELARHYLWRFWRHVPAGGRLAIFDRSWYGRVLVERVEGFASEAQWQRAYQEINDFEEQLADQGILICKFWIHISADEQLRRFREREEIPWKQHKITDEDWRNREKGPAYQQAINEMVARCSTEYAPWTIIAGNCKRAARIDVMQTVADALERRLGGAATSGEST